MAGTKHDAELFVERWRGRGNEDQDTQLFWIGLFQDVLGLSDALDRLKFEQPVSTAASEHQGFIDVLIPTAKTIIEQKSLGIDLSKAEIRQGRPVTPAQQALGYVGGMALSQKPRYIVACNFAEFWIYDTETDPLCKKDPLKIALEDIPNNLPAIQFLAGKGEAPDVIQRKVDVEAGRIMGRIHDAVARSFESAGFDRNDEDVHHAISAFCTRIMFLMFCEDQDGLIPPNCFKNYIQHYSADDLRKALLDLFAWLDTPDDERDPFASDLLKAFPYMNGGLFAERTQIPTLNEDVRTTIIVEGCQEFDWADVNPTVFGSIFEGSLSHDERRSGGMHYTSPENIHKVIDPLFLESLEREFLDACVRPEAGGARTKALNELHDKLGRISILDPACGSGNFLTESYMCLRRLENRIFYELSKDGQTMLDVETADMESMVKVNLRNFHGIEINDFACSVARTALWIAEKQADSDTSNIVHRVHDELPLTDYGTIHQGNALRMDWNDVVPASECTYICGNPPFIGHTSRKKNPNLSKDMELIWGKDIDIDYVSCWYRKAVDYYRENRDGRFAFVSTNSITQGGQPQSIFAPIFEEDWVIFFAHRTFFWESQADDQAHVHVVVIGLCDRNHLDERPKLYYYSNNKEEGAREAENINAYLIDGPNIFVTTRSNSKGCLSPELPLVYAGSMANDGGNLLLNTREEYEMAMADPIASKYVRPFLMGEEFINRVERWCLWMQKAPMQDIVASSYLRKRVEAVKELRLASTRKSTREKLSKTPQLFGENHQPSSEYLAIPRVFSEGREWTTCAMLSPNVIAGDKVYTCTDSDGFAFAIIESSMFMTWQKAVGGRMKSDPSFSNTLVWNNIPLGSVSKEQRDAVCAAGQNLLKVRERYPEESLASLYSPLGMHPDLIAAHELLDKHVDKAFCGHACSSNDERLAELFRLYAEMINN